MWKLLIKYRFVILFLMPLGLSAMLTTASCNPYRAGSTVRPVGGVGSSKHHTKTTSSKARKKRKY